MRAELQPHDIPTLVAVKLLKPLGNPPPKGIKYFATSDLLEFIKDRNWVARVSAAICQHWQRKNARRKQSVTNGQISSLLLTSRFSLILTNNKTI